MADRRWFSFWWFLLGFFVALFACLIGVPVRGSNTRDARAAEGEQILGSMKGMARLAHDQSGGHAPSKLTGTPETGGSGLELRDLQGRYYQILDHVSSRGQERGAMFALPKRRDSPVIQIDFPWRGGDGVFSSSR